MSRSQNTTNEVGLAWPRYLHSPGSLSGEMLRQSVTPMRSSSRTANTSQIALPFRKPARGLPAASSVQSATRWPPPHYPAPPPAPGPAAPQRCPPDPSRAASPSPSRSQHGPGPPLRSPQLPGGRAPGCSLPRARRPAGQTALPRAGAAGCAGVWEERGGPAPASPVPCPHPGGPGALWRVRGGSPGGQSRSGPSRAPRAARGWPPGAVPAARCRLCPCCCCCCCCRCCSPCSGRAAPRRLR